MRPLTCIVAACLAAAGCQSAKPTRVRPAMLKFESIPLWAGKAPQATGDGPRHTPALTVHRPAAGEANGAAVIVCGGGGYNIIMHDHEGLQVAKWLNRMGVTAFRLHYRLKPGGYDSSVSLLDGRRAVRYVRHHAERFGIAPDCVGMIGFSAGGHLCANVALNADDGDPAAEDPIERQSCRPNRLLLIYTPCPLGQDAADREKTLARVQENFPPTFFFLTHEDEPWFADG